MTLRLSILSLLALTLTASAQTPPKAEWSWHSLIIWQVPTPPPETLTFQVQKNIGNHRDFVVQRLRGLGGKWEDTGIALSTNYTFTVTNSGSVEFFRVGVTNFLHIGWTANVDPVVAAYKVYLGTNSRSYLKTFDVGNTNEAFIPAEDGTNFIAVTSCDGYWEGDFSEELACTNNPVKPIIKPMTAP